MVNIITGQDLVDIIQEGQVKAFTHFYTLFFQKLLLESDKYVKDVAVAEELVQDVFMKVWESPESLEDVRSVKSYLYRSVINASINYLNRQKNIEQHHQKIAADYSEEYLMELDEENRLVVLLRIEIEKLPPQCKKVFKLNRFEKLKYREIADLLDISERTVENHIANALKILREALLDKKNIDKESKPFQKIVTLYLY
ncbi:RNA polymerase sigma-70 factor [Pedobacter sp. KR3-3]|uniref:RNA polymerase sigma-70 factor n=1 Tax=Pedobacter albus TaxID=3113905 RepID=A0ABU7I9K5_9SPHI|nr:RNA polymerase sigma-70 factor [Pedobacter sp. KR3-3]MEE1946042.1 RNA polymerase sigma-70 factor [Pedobacter sp. KR3-3]